MDKNEIIRDIESLFPIDSEYPDTNEVGVMLLIRSIEQFDWRNLPEELLIIYRNQCIWKDQRDCDNAIRKSKY